MPFYNFTVMESYTNPKVPTTGTYGPYLSEPIQNFQEKIKNAFKTNLRLNEDTVIHEFPTDPNNPPINYLNDNKIYICKNNAGSNMDSRINDGTKVKTYFIPFLDGHFYLQIFPVTVKIQNTNFQDYLCGYYYCPKGNPSANLPGNLAVLLSNNNGTTYNYKINYHIAISENNKIANIKIRTMNTIDSGNTTNYDIDFVVIKIDESPSQALLFSNSAEEHVEGGLRPANASTQQYFAFSSTGKDMIGENRKNNYVIKNRFPYSYLSNNYSQIQLLNKKILISVDEGLTPAQKVSSEHGVFERAIDELYDCSYVEADKVFSINGQQYYSINNFTLMKI